jgi:hypothetical protein
VNKEYKPIVSQKLGFKVGPSVPLARADSAVADTVVEVYMRVVALPGFVEGIVSVFEELL